MRGYPIGTVVQEKSGRAKVKVGEREWIGRGRYEYQKANPREKVNGDQRVFHIDGDRFNDDPDNLVAITFTGTIYNLSHSRVIHLPKSK